MRNSINERILGILLERFIKGLLELALQVRIASSFAKPYTLLRHHFTPD